MWSLVIASKFFFFYVYGAHRNLSVRTHSFPTRRSSDLIATVFLKVGMNVLWDARLSVTDMVNEGVRRAYNHPDNKLRASVLADPEIGRASCRERVCQYV